MTNNEQTKHEDCFIERQIEKMISYIKSHKLLFAITVSINFCIMAFTFVLWYLYSHALPELKNTDKLSAIFNFFIVIGTMMLSAFAWMAYRYATHQYINNEIVKKRFDQRYNLIQDLITDLVTPINIYAHLIGTYSLLKRCIDNENERPELYLGMIEKHEYAYEHYRTKHISDSVLFIKNKAMLTILGGEVDITDKIETIQRIFNELLFKNYRIYEFNELKLEICSNPHRISELLEKSLENLEAIQAEFNKLRECVEYVGEEALKLGSLLDTSSQS